MKIKIDVNSENQVIGYAVSPITEDMIDITETEFLFIQKNIDHLKYENGQFEIDATKIKRTEIFNRINDLKKMLSETNQYAIEFASGEITAEQFEPIKLQRQSWRNEINKLEGELEE